MSDIGPFSGTAIDPMSDIGPFSGAAIDPLSDIGPFSGAAIDPLSDIGPFSGAAIDPPSDIGPFSATAIDGPSSLRWTMPVDSSLISVTAKLAAYYRQFTDIPFAADIARGIGADEAFEQLARDHALEREKLTFYAPMFEARYKSLTELIRKSGASQVLELASGYSLRALDLTRDGTMRYVETDLSGVTATKLALLEDLRRRNGLESNPNHVVAVADALDLEQVRAAAAVLDHGKPVVVLCEGLILYLSREETERLAANVRSVLGEFAGGCWMTPDFLFGSEARDLPPERVRLREAVSGVTQRQFDANAFEDADDLRAFLHRHGFDVAVRSQVDETPAFSSIPALGLPPALVERFRPSSRVWLMTPR